VLALQAVGVFVDRALEKIIGDSGAVEKVLSYKKSIDVKVVSKCDRRLWGNTEGRCSLSVRKIWVFQQLHSHLFAALACLRIALSRAAGASCCANVCNIGFVLPLQPQQPVFQNAGRQEALG